MSANTNLLLNFAVRQTSMSSSICFSDSDYSFGSHAKIEIKRPFSVECVLYCAVTSLTILGCGVF